MWSQELQIMHKNRLQSNIRIQSLQDKIQIKHRYDCKSRWCVYCIECTHCGSQYVGSTIQEVHNRMNGHRHTITHNDGGCKVVEHFNDTCLNDEDVHEYFKFYVIDHINDDDIDGTDEEVKYLDSILCYKERYWQAQLGTIWSGINGTVDWYNQFDNRRNWAKEVAEIRSNVRNY
eukprot:295876_1